MNNNLFFNIIEIFPKIIMTYIFIFNNVYINNNIKDSFIVNNDYTFLKVLSYGVFSFVVMEIFYYCLKDVFKEVYDLLKRKEDLN